MTNKFRNSKGKIIPYILLIIFAVIVIVPVSWAFLASIKENSEFYGNPWALPQGFHWQNFADAFQKANMGAYFLNSVLVTALALIILLVVAVPAAYVLSRYSFFGKKLINALYMGGLFINVSYIVVPIFLMLVDADKWIKNILGHTLFINNLFVLAVIYAATALPFTIYLLRSYFLTISEVYSEAAQVDGCSNLRIMLQIMLPMARPGIVTVVLFNFLAFWNEYIISMTLLTGENKTLPVGIMNLMKAQNASAEYGQMYAGLVIVMLPTLILYILLQKKITEGMSIGGIKG